MENENHFAPSENMTMPQEFPNEEILSQSNYEHSHHWRIEEVDGPYSVGNCNNCGAQKEFKNYFSAADFILLKEEKYLDF